jgi:hypothetical protein
MLNSTSAPLWQADCSRGGCYVFDGNDSMYITGGLSLTGSEIAFPIGAETVSDPWFESFDTIAQYDDNISDSWFYWFTSGADNNNVFDATLAQAHDGVSVHVSTKDLNSPAHIYQTAFGLTPSSPYTFSLWSKGASGRYKLELGNGSCLAANGSWGAADCNLTASASNATYVQTIKEFATPPAGTAWNLKIYLYPNASSNTHTYYDSVSLKRTSGMNGGFENYYLEGNFVPPE